MNIAEGESLYNTLTPVTFAKECAFKLARNHTEKEAVERIRKK